MCWARYFGTALKARASFELYLVLQRGGLVPGGTYPKARYDAAFTTGLGTPALLSCDENNGLREVGICLGRQYQPGDMASGCSDAVTRLGLEGGCDFSSPISFVATAPAPAPRPPPPPPGPPATQCMPDRHGPPCKTDADCIGKTNCRRCAHSGFCTEEPPARMVQEN